MGGGSLVVFVVGGYVYLCVDMCFGWCLCVGVCVGNVCWSVDVCVCVVVVVCRVGVCVV